MILQILFIPIMMIVGGIVGVLLFIDAMTISPFLGLGVLLIGVGTLIAVGRWEWHRVGKEMSSEDDLYPRR